MKRELNFTNGEMGNTAYIPVPVKILLYAMMSQKAEVLLLCWECLQSTNDRAYRGTADRGEDDEGNRILLISLLPHISDHTQGDGPAGTGNTAKKTANDHSSEIWRECTGDLPNYVARDQVRAKYQKTE